MAQKVNKGGRKPAKPAAVSLAGKTGIQRRVQEDPKGKGKPAAKGPAPKPAKKATNRKR